MTKEKLLKLKTDLIKRRKAVKRFQKLHVDNGKSDAVHFYAGKIAVYDLVLDRLEEDE